MKNQGPLTRNYKACWQFLKQTKNYIWFSLGIFLLFAIIGFIFPIFFQEEIFQFIQELLSKLEGLNVYELIIYIFFNNLKASFFAILFGIAFGIFPLFTAVVNGYLLGFIARHIVAQEGAFILWRIFPHGIFELPAIIISIGIGLKIGVEVLKRNGKLKENFREAARFFVFVILPLLIIAGVIEGFLVFFVR